VSQLIDDLHRHANLRQRAARQMRGSGKNVAVDPGSSAALGVLHKLASSPDTATEALCLLHELQVYQVEIELQDEELRASRAELESLLHRQVQLYDHSPAGSFTIDHATVIVELNLGGARSLGLPREAALGQRFDAFLTANDRLMLGAMLELASSGQTGAECELRLNAWSQNPKTVRVSAAVDPAGPRFVLASIELAAGRES
jgi:PAS domain-containing protein